MIEKDYVFRKAPTYALNRREEIKKLTNQINMYNQKTSEKVKKILELVEKETGIYYEDLAVPIAEIIE